MTDTTPSPSRPTSAALAFLEGVPVRRDLALRDIPAAGGMNSPDGKAILAARLELQREDVPRLLAMIGRALDVETNAKVLAAHVDYATRDARVVCTDCDADLGPDNGTSAWEAHDRHVVELLNARVLGEAP